MYIWNLAYIHLCNRSPASDSTSCLELQPVSGTQHLVRTWQKARKLNGWTWTYSESLCEQSWASHCQASIGSVLGLPSFTTVMFSAYSSKPVKLQTTLPVTSFDCSSWRPLRLSRSTENSRRCWCQTTQRYSLHLHTENCRRLKQSSSSWQLILELWRVTCHMKSHSLTPSQTGQ